MLTGCEVARVVAPPADLPVTAPPEHDRLRPGRRRPQRIRATIARSFRTRGDRTRITRLTVKQVPAGAALVLTCKPPRRARGACPFRRVERRLAAAARAVKLLPRFEGRRLRAGTDRRAARHRAGDDRPGS